jgi:hypothetical protein
MMDISCDIIRDLLPLYHDGVCSADSRALVEEHLKGCAGCRAELDKFGAPDKTDNVDEARLIAGTARVWKRSRAEAFFKGAFIVAFIACAACGVAYNAIGSYIAPDGTLVEPFGLIPLAWLFAFLGAIFAVCFACARIWRRRK